MKWLKHNELTINDMESLVGTDLIADLLRHRLVLVYGINEKPFTAVEMGLFDLTGMFHMRELHGRPDTIELLFEHRIAISITEETLTQLKLSRDG